jgi:hypothetical protein
MHCGRQTPVCCSTNHGVCGDELRLFADGFASEKIVKSLSLPDKPDGFSMHQQFASAKARIVI